MVRLTQKDVSIIRELIRNPRISDNKISKRTGIPVMTVNRRRKEFEKQGLISYYADFHHGEKGIENFNIKQLYIIKFKSSVSREMYFKKFLESKMDKKFNSQYITEAYLGEREGRLALMLIVNAKNEREMVDIFNGKIIPILHKKFGEDCIRGITTARITDLIRTHHNYLPRFNMKEGSIKKSWPDEWIFVSRESHGLD